MADPISEERLREIVSTPLSLAPTVCNYVDAWYFAAELIAARADVEQMRAAMREALSRADPREALSLLRNIDWDKDNWDERYKALLAKHKETNQ